LFLLAINIMNSTIEIKAATMHAPVTTPMVTPRFLLLPDV
jgi:hypothetical protein